MQAREVMAKHRGKWTANGKSATRAYRSLEVACRMLGIPTPPIAKRPPSNEQPYQYQAQESQVEGPTAQGDFVANTREQDIEANDVLRPKRRRK